MRSVFQRRHQRLGGERHPATDIARPGGLRSTELPRHWGHVMPRGYGGHQRRNDGFAT